MAISINPKPAICRNLYENTGTVSFSIVNYQITRVSCEKKKFQVATINITGVSMFFWGGVFFLLKVKFKNLWTAWK